MQSRLAVAALGGVGISIVGYNYFSPSLSTSSSSTTSSSGYTNLKIYKRFKQFANSNSNSKNDEPEMSVYDFVDSLTSSSSTKNQEGKSSTKIVENETNSKRQDLESIFKTNSALKNDFDKLISLVDIDGNGSINFQEYATLQTLLAASVDQLKGAVELFDRSNTNRVNSRQFKALLRSLSAGHIGATSSSSSSSISDAASDSSLAKFFFGADGQQTVSFEDFLGRLSEIRRIVRTIEFHLAVNRDGGNSGSNTKKATVDAVRRRLLGNPITGSASSSVSDGNTNDDSSSSTTTTTSQLQSSSFKQPFDEKLPLVDINDYMVFMSLLAQSDEWTPALELFLNNNPEKNQITYDMLSRVLRDVDVSSRIPFNSNVAKEGGLKIDSSRGPTRHVRVFVTKKQSDLFCQLMDQNGDGTIDVSEVQKLAKAHGSFFAAFVPQFNEAPRNAIQQWFYCMQQK